MAEELAGKRILIWGYGREGKSTESFLERSCQPASVEVYEGGREGIREEDYDLIIKSPGIAMEEDHPKYTSQTELFLRRYRSQTVGITGTKGKSTTSSLLSHVLRECSGRPVLLLGNIGVPCFDAIEEITEDAVIVFELSCHQLAHVKASPHVAAFLNLYEEHLDYYGTFERYFRAKANIAKYQERGDLFYAGGNVPEIGTEASVSRVSAGDAGPFRLRLLGEHNQLNAEFAFRIATEAFHLDGEAARESMAGFTGLAHRLEYVGERDGIAFYDDSISTIPEAAIQAAESVPGVQTLLLGGMDRNIDYGVLVEYARSHPRLSFICCYASGKRIYDSLEGCGNCYYEEDLERAVERAKKVTMPGRACVLSPAAASYGYFKDFEERGDRFREYALGTGHPA